MTPRELRAAFSLASIFGLRLLGMFIILPIFALWARNRPGWDLQLAGIAMGAYGLTQALLQIPFGRLSDRYGRKPMLYLGLTAMAAGSFICAFAAGPAGMILGRVVQGVGAVSGVAIATAADLTRETQRTKAMAIIGSTIGVAFAVSFVAAPSLQHAIGLAGIFGITGLLAIAAMAVVRFLVPDAPVAAPAARATGLRRVFMIPELLRLNFGIFSLHAVLMAMFIVAPVAMVRAGLPVQHHWWIYLGAMLCGFILMGAVVRRGNLPERPTFLGAVASIAIGLVVLAAGLSSLAAIATGLVIFFAGFNVLEAKLPALVSRAAPADARGAATGVYSSVQYLGTFVGAAAGGSIAQHAGFVAVLVVCLAVVGLWLVIAWGMGDFAAAAQGAARH